MTVERAVGILIETQRIVAEGAGAAGIAAILCHPPAFKNCKVGVVIGGGNINSRLLSQILMRTLVLDGRMATLRIEIIDQPGVMSTITKVIGQTGGNIMDITHHRMFVDLPVKRAESTCWSRRATLTMSPRSSKSLNRLDFPRAA